MMESFDDVFALFDKERRRFALYYLDQADGPVQIEELVEQIHTWETEGSSDSVPDDEFREIILSLEHNHLPEIEDVTHIEYNRDTQQVRITGIPAEVEVLLSVSKSIEQPASSTDITEGEIV